MLPTNYPIPPMEQILQLVSGYELFSLLDDFSGYNQFHVAEPDRLKNTFWIKWGMRDYRIIPFGLMNVGAIFQREKDISFKGLINKCVVVYLDDVNFIQRNGKTIKII
jgi:hypothetical protein